MHDCSLYRCTYAEEGVLFTLRRPDFQQSLGTFLAEVVICWKCVALANVDICIKKVLDSVVFIYSVASPVLIVFLYDNWQ